MRFDRVTTNLDRVDDPFVNVQRWLNSKDPGARLYAIAISDIDDQ